MNNYTNFLKWALVSFIDRSTQDDKKSKLQIEGLFKSPAQIEDNYIIRNKHIKRYILHVDDLGVFEKFYNDIQILNDNFGDRAIYHIKDLNYNCDLENKFRHILDIWTDTKL